MPITLVLNNVEHEDMPLDQNDLRKFSSSMYSDSMRRLADRLLGHVAQSTEIMLKQFDQYVESCIFDPVALDEESEEKEIGGSTISLNDGIGTDGIMARLNEDVDPSQNGGVPTKYAALLWWRKGVATVYYFTVQEEPK